VTPITTTYVNVLNTDPKTNWTVTETWDPTTLTLSFKFNPNFWDTRYQNTMPVRFDGDDVTHHEATIRRLMAQLQSIADTGKYTEEM